MSNFNKAYELLEKWEGGYSNHFADTGGETYKGITRKNYPNMSFWKSIDKLKEEGRDKSDIDFILGKNEAVEKEIKEFYKKNYWDILDLDDVPCQEFAENLFLLGVNAGIKRAVKIGQQSCDIAVDGIYGANTKKAFNNATKNNVDAFNKIEIEFYKGLVKKRPEYKVFLNGWLNRAGAV